MKSLRQSQKKFHLIIVISILFTLVFSSCNAFQQSSSVIEVVNFTETVENYPEAEVIFQVKVSSPISSDEKMVLEIIDDVTGVYFNPSHFEMEQQDEQSFLTRVSLIIGEKIKYRFLRQGSETSTYEYTSQNKQVPFRVLLVNGPILIQDTVVAWADQPYSGPVGRIRGQLIDKTNNTPIPNMAIYAAGMRTLSAADGTFILEGLPIWTHNVVISSLDGSYETFQQGAVISEEATTPIFLSIQKRPMVDVTFEVKTPDGFTTDLPLRLASNLFSLGFAEAELASGSSMSSANLPVFTKTSDNLYSLKLPLPVGTDIKYKFTFGDGFWNSELTNDGSFITRDLIVPSSNATIKKEIKTIKSPDYGEILIKLTTPVTTPVNDTISLQLNPFGWMEPLPMVKIGENQWSYTLYSPIHLLGNVTYRFCRNDQCDSAISSQSQDGIFIGINSTQTMSTNLETWQYMDSAAITTTVDTDGGNIQPRTDFIAGFELIPDFPSSWTKSVDQGLQVIYSTGANWVILSPTWTATSVNPPLLEPVPGSDLLWPELQSLISKITTAKLQPVLFPLLSESSSKDFFWSMAKKDAGWWQSFFDRYQRFILQNADLATITNASAIIIGDPGMKPAMNNGVLTNGDFSSAPPNADAQWSQLIQDIRARYKGPVVGVISLPDKNSTPPGWLKDVDAIYVLFSPSLVDSGDKSVSSLRETFDNALDSMIKPIATQYSKPIILGINYPSTQTALTGCTAINDSCLSYKTDKMIDSVIDMDLQTKIYNAAIISSVNRNWINGFISRGFNPMVVIKDQSSSIYGKPASDVLWFWYHFVLNKPS